MFAEPNPTVIKAVLHAHGRIPTAAVRLPLLPAGSGTVQAALQLLDAERVPIVGTELGQGRRIIPPRMCGAAAVTGGYYGRLMANRITSIAIDCAGPRLSSAC